MLFLKNERYVIETMKCKMSDFLNSNMCFCLQPYGIYLKGPVFWSIFQKNIVVPFVEIMSKFQILAHPKTRKSV